MKDEITQVAPVSEIKSPYSMFGTDKTQEENGVAIDYGYFAIIVKRAGQNNKQFKAKLRRVNEQKGKRMQIGAVTDDEMEDDMIRLFAETVVVGWREVRNEQNELIPFSVDACVKLFKDLPDLFLDVRTQAMDFHTFLEVEIEEASKN